MNEVLVWVVANVAGLSAVGWAFTFARMRSWQRRAEGAERALGLFVDGPPPRAGLCPHVVETTALVSCDLPKDHAGPCRCGELDAWRAR